jgi:hypothetical protein
MQQAKAVKRTPAQWEALAEEAFTGFREWRSQHPRATLTEIEEALDARWARVRARIVGDAALASAAADLRLLPVGERPRCARCAVVLELAGREERELTTTYEQGIHLERSAARCPACGRRVFPPG